jgi:hypothetical protein
MTLTKDWNVFRYQPINNRIYRDFLYITCISPKNTPFLLCNIYERTKKQCGEHKNNIYFITWEIKTSMRIA